jgi:glycosidase
MLGVLINRDDVRTPMQWDGTRNAGFSSAAQTWLPVHEKYTSINVEGESLEDSSLLNTIRALLEIRGREKALQEGSLELMNGLPENILGFMRSAGRERNIILLNFGDETKSFSIKAAECIFKLNPESRFDGTRVWLDGYGALILK